MRRFSYLQRFDLKVRLAMIGCALVAIQSMPATQGGGVVGVSRQGENAAEYIGIIQQEGAQFRAYGYLTHIRGVNSAAMFVGPPSEATALFIFAAQAQIDSQAQVGSTIQIGAPGTLSIRHNPAAGASFNDPASFLAGTEIARLDVRFHNVLSVIAPNTGIASGTAFGTQVAAASFTVNGANARYGHIGARHRFTLFGKGIRAVPEPPESTTEFAAFSVTD